MYKIIGGDHKEYGPIGPEDLLRWIVEGRLNAQSLVWSEGATQWQPLASLPEFAEALGAAAAKAHTPGPPVPTAPAPSSLVAAILARPVQLQIGVGLSRAWTLLRANFGLLFGASALFWLICVVCQLIPLIGGLTYGLLRGVLYGGLCLIFLRRIRGQSASAGEVFGGFGPPFLQLLLAGFLTSLLGGLAVACCFILPGIYLLVAWTFSVPLVADQGLEFWSAMELSRKVVTRVWFEMFGLLIVAFLPLIAATVFVQIKLVSMVLPLFLDAMSNGQMDFGRLFPTLTKIALTSLPLTALLKVVGLLNLPFAVSALMYAYEDLFGARPAPAP